MKSIDVIYKFGHLYNRETNKRILIEDSSRVSIVIQPENLLEEDQSVVAHGVPLTSQQKAQEIELKYGAIIPYWLIKKANESLFFRIAGYVPKRHGKEAFSLEFRLELLEDLYIYNKKPERAEMAQLYPCQCAILECLTDNFVFFEPIYGDSLNKARTKLHELYFSRVVNPASNAFREFFIDRSCHSGQSLGELSRQVQRQTDTI